MNLFTNTRTVTALGLLGEGDYFSFIDTHQDSPGVYQVLKQSENQVLIQGVEYTATFNLPTTIKVYVWKMLH